MADINRIREIAKDLGLHNLAAGRISVTNETLSNTDYLFDILTQEAEFRKDSRAARLRKRSHLPRKRFDISVLAKGLQWQLAQLENQNWITDGQNIIILGKCSSWKTSLAVNLAENAIQEGHKTFYITLDDFIDILKLRERQSRANGYYNYMKECEVIIIDDFLYITPSAADLQMIYRAFNFFGEDRSLVIISNRDISDWTNFSEDVHLAQTMTERITSGSQIIRL